MPSTPVFFYGQILHSKMKVIACLIRYILVEHISIPWGGEAPVFPQESGRQWKIAILSVLAPGLGQWANNQTYKALAFLCIHSCAITWLCTPLITSGHLPSNRWLLTIGMMALWAFSVFDAYTCSGRRSMPLFDASAHMRMHREIALVIVLAALTALDFTFPDPMIKSLRIPILTPSVPIAVAAIFDPIAGGIGGVMAIFLQFCFQPYGFSMIGPRCLSILAACGLGALAAKKSYLLAGLSAVVPNAVNLSFLSRETGYTILSLAMLEHSITHWAIVLGVVKLLSLIKKWYLNHPGLAGAFERKPTVLN